MNRVVYVNGEFIPETEAKISIFDRGFLFADGVYEVTAIINGKLIGWHGHISRLNRSLNEINMPMPESEAKILELHRSIVELNNLSQGIVYMQVSRGSTDRDFNIVDGLRPSLVMFTQELNLLDPKRLDRSLRVMTVNDIRWGKNHIKTIQLLASSLIKTEAIKKGYDDAWLIRDGYVTEGTSSNAFIIDCNKSVITRNLGCEILSGITRSDLLSTIKKLGLKVEERPFSIDEAKGAREAFITSASNFVVSIGEIDDTSIGSGSIGQITQKLQDEYITQMVKASI